MSKPEDLGEGVQRYGYAKKKKVKLCGKELELVSDPISPHGDEVFVDAREKGTERAIEPLCILWCIPGFRSNSWTPAFK